MTEETYEQRILRIRDEVELGMNCKVKLGKSSEGRYYYQIQCWREDVITKKMGMGYGGKGYLSEHMTQNELVQIIFGLYKSYWEHEARETFKWRKRRVFGPHIDVEALWKAAPYVDVRSAQHVEDES